jgi:hypothetical protein
VTYEAPAIEERTEVGGPVIVGPVGSPIPESPAWRRTGDDKADVDD